jgi:hypothetical protein
MPNKTSIAKRSEKGLLTPDNCVVTIIDLQPQMLFGVGNFDRQSVINNNEILCKAARVYTQGSSWFSSESGKKGAIAPGQLADFAALTDDFFAVPEEKIKSIESVLTVVGGKIVHPTDEFAPHAPPPIPVLPAWSPVKVFGGYGAPLDARRAARAGVPLQPHLHRAEGHHHGGAHAAHQLLEDTNAA